MIFSFSVFFLNTESQPKQGQLGTIDCVTK